MVDRDTVRSASDTFSVQNNVILPTSLFTQPRESALRDLAFFMRITGPLEPHSRRSRKMQQHLPRVATPKSAWRSLRSSKFGPKVAPQHERSNGTTPLLQARHLSESPNVGFCDGKQVREMHVKRASSISNRKCLQQMSISYDETGRS